MNFKLYLPAVLAASFLTGCNDEPFSQYDCDYVDHGGTATNFVIQANALTSEKAAREQVELARDAGFDAITTPFFVHDGPFAGRKLYDTPEKAAIYHAMALAAHRSGARCLALIAWVPQLNDMDFWKKNPKLRMKTRNSLGWPVDFMEEKLLNPLMAAVRTHNKKKLKEIQLGFDIDGFSLDRIRYAKTWGGIGKDAEEAFNKTMPKTKQVKFRDFNDDLNTDYHEWRKDVIADYIKDVTSVINPGLQIRVFGFSPAWGKHNAQDPARMAPYIDGYDIMLYGDDWGYNTSWIWGGEEYYNDQYPSDAPAIWSALELGFPENKIGAVLEYHWLEDSDNPNDYTYDDMIQILSGLKNNYPDLPMITIYHHAGMATETHFYKAGQVLGYFYD